MPGRLLPDNGTSGPLDQCGFFGDNGYTKCGVDPPGVQWIKVSGTERSRMRNGFEGNECGGMRTRMGRGKGGRKMNRLSVPVDLKFAILPSVASAEAMDFYSDIKWLVLMALVIGVSALDVLLCLAVLCFRLRLVSTLAVAFFSASTFFFIFAF